MNLRFACLGLLLVPPLAGCGGADVQDAADGYLSSVRTSSGGTPQVQDLMTAQDELPQSARLTGLSDDDGDEMDDDGLVALNLDGEWRCITLPDDDSEGDVSAGACA